MFKHLSLLAALALGAALLGGCPDTAKEVGHAPKQQIDKVERAVDKAELKMQKQVDKAAAAENAE